MNKAVCLLWSNFYCRSFFLPFAGLDLESVYLCFVFNLQLLREELLSCGTVLQISDLPDDGFSDQDIKKIVQPFGKVSDLIVLRSRNEVGFPLECFCVRMQKKLSSDEQVWYLDPQLSID